MNMGEINLSANKNRDFMQQLWGLQWLGRIMSSLRAIVIVYDCMILYVHIRIENAIVWIRR